MTADQELDRVVAWLRREALARQLLADIRNKHSRQHDARIVAAQAKVLEAAADRLAQLDHREITNEA